MNGRVFGLRFSPDGKRIAAAGGLDGKGELVVCSYDLDADVPANILGIMAKVPGENRTKGSQRSAEEWKTLDDYRDASTKLLARVAIPEAMAYATAFRPATNEVAVAGADGIVRFFDGDTGAAKGRFPVARIDSAATARTKLPLPWPPEPSLEPDPPAPAAVTALAVEPAEVSLNGPFAATQLVITGRLADGSAIDLTRIDVTDEAEVRQRAGALDLHRHHGGHRLSAAAIRDPQPPAPIGHRSNEAAGTDRAQPVDRRPRVSREPHTSGEVDRTAIGEPTTSFPCIR